MPNKACTRRWGVWRDSKHFSTPQHFSQSDGVPPPAPARVTQTVRQPKCKTKCVFVSPFRFADCVWNLRRLFFYINFVCLRGPHTPRKDRGVCFSIDAKGLSLVRNCAA